VKIAIVLAFATLPTTGVPNAPATREVEIVASDYAFRLPPELPAGRTAFRLRNTGKVFHEFHLLLLKPGSTIEEFIRFRRERRPTVELVEGPVGILFAGPGKTTLSRLSTDLVAGRDYVAECALRDSAAAPTHLDMGMFSVVHVKTSKAPKALPPVRADTIVGMDYAFRYPHTVSPGRHTFVFRNEGKVRHEMTIALLAKGVTLERFLDVLKAGGDTRPLIEEESRPRAEVPVQLHFPKGLLHARPGKASLGRLEVDLLPSRDYRLICTLADDPKASRHFELGMYGVIRVSAQPTSRP